MLTYEGRHQITLYKQCVRANCAVKTETAQGAAPAYAFMLSCEDWPKRPGRWRRGIATSRRVLTNKSLPSQRESRAVWLAQGNIMQQANEDLRARLQANLDVAAGICRLGFMYGEQVMTLTTETMHKWVVHQADHVPKGL